MRRAQRRKAPTLPDAPRSSRCALARPRRAGGTLERVARALGLALTTSELRTIANAWAATPASSKRTRSTRSGASIARTRVSRAHLQPLADRRPDRHARAGRGRGDRAPGRMGRRALRHRRSRTSRTTIPRKSCRSRARRPAIGGIVRDVLCMGARVIAVADPLRFGPRDDAHSRYVAQGVVDGIAAYGNAIGVPNIARRRLLSTRRFDDNVLVNVVALGLVKEDEVIHSLAPPGSAGWDIVLVGKATDRSGFGGAVVFLADARRRRCRGATRAPFKFPTRFSRTSSCARRTACSMPCAARGIDGGFKDLGAGGFVGCTRRTVPRAAASARIVDLDRVPTRGARSAAGGHRGRRDAGAFVLDRAAGVHAARCSQSTTKSSRCRVVARGARAAVIGKVTRRTRLRLAPSRRRSDARPSSSSSPAESATNARCDDRRCERPRSRSRRRNAARAGRRRAARARARAPRRVFAARRSTNATIGVVRGTTVDPARLCRRRRDRADPGRAARRRARRRRESALRQARSAACGRARRRAKRSATSSRSARGRSASPIV